MSAFKPMLAGTIKDATALPDVPLVMSPKLDGIRCLIVGGKAVSRNLKPIPNASVQAALAGLPDGLDGELIVGDMFAPDVWNKTQSGCMSAEGEPKFTYHVFDMFGEIFTGGDTVHAGSKYVQRLGLLTTMRDRLAMHSAAVLSYEWMESLANLETYEQRVVAQGAEGVMLRHPDKPYKCGRSTPREFGLMKLKRFFDAEFEVIGFEELMRNANALERDNLGHAKRSKKKAGMVAADTLGALVCTIAPVEEIRAKMGALRGLSVKHAEEIFGKDRVFTVGSGFTQAQRDALWADRESLTGLGATVKYQELSPAGVPRFPVFMRFRGVE